MELFAYIYIHICILYVYICVWMRNVHFMYEKLYSFIGVLGYRVFDTGQEATFSLHLHSSLID
jgi:hypothetical protein